MFKRKNKQPNNATTRRNYFQSLQQKWADQLHRKTIHWNKAHKIIFLICTYLLIGSCSIYCLINIGKNRNRFENIFKESGTINYHPTPDLPQPSQLHFDSLLLHEFYKKHDSLMQTDSGRKQIEAFKKIRPGFLDSIKNANELFNHFLIP